MPDATGLELIAHELRERDPDGVLGTVFFRDRATLLVSPRFVPAALEHLRGQGYTFLSSVHGVDYFPEEPRLGVHYELVARARVDRLRVKLRVGTDRPEVPTVTDIFPGAMFDERETYDMFGVVFTGNPDLRRILMPEDYVGHPLRRDFPIGGEPVIFTFNEGQMPNWYE